jgi:acyl-CoA dehydrogenase
MRALSIVLSGSPLAAPIQSMAEWWERHRAATRDAGLPIDEAILGGFIADRLGYAFAAGYEAALHRLFPDLPRDRIASLCVTERAGAAPRAIEARLSPHEERHWKLDGQKRWATLSGDGGVLLVAASEGTDEGGRNRIRIARVESTAPGVLLSRMPETPFVPEIPHAEVKFEDVVVSEDALLPGDGYTRYIKPFRTVEDIHVHAAALAYLIRETRAIDAPRPLQERLSAAIVALYSLAGSDPSAPEVHIALAGVLGVSKALLSDIELIWERSESPAHARWNRDKLIFSVAEGARGKRLERAWGHFESIATAARAAEKSALS